MDLQLTGKKALVTGSTAGIGFATAAGLYQEGASVVVNGRTPQRVESAIERIRAMTALVSPRSRVLPPIYRPPMAPRTSCVRFPTSTS